MVTPGRSALVVGRPPSALDPISESVVLSRMAGPGHSGPSPIPSSVGGELERLITGPLATAPMLVGFLRFIVEEPSADAAISSRVHRRRSGTRQASDLRLGHRRIGPGCRPSAPIQTRRVLPADVVPGDVLIELPKGRYVPAFSTRPASTGTGAWPTAARRAGRGSRPSHGNRRCPAFVDMGPPHSGWRCPVRHRQLRSEIDLATRARRLGSVGHCRPAVHASGSSSTTRAGPSSSSPARAPSRAM